jgi:hypothetical protein
VGRDEARPSNRFSYALSADENKDTCENCEQTQEHGGNNNRVGERNDAHQDQVNGQQQHADIFCEVHEIIILTSCRVYNSKRYGVASGYLEAPSARHDYRTCCPNGGEAPLGATCQLCTLFDGFKNISFIIGDIMPTQEFHILILE